MSTGSGGGVGYVSSFIEFGPLVYYIFLKEYA